MSTRTFVQQTKTDGVLAGFTIRIEEGEMTLPGSDLKLPVWRAALRSPMTAPVFGTPRLFKSLAEQDVIEMFERIKKLAADRGEPFAEVTEA